MTYFIVLLPQWYCPPSLPFLTFAFYAEVSTSILTSAVMATCVLFTLKFSISLSGLQVNMSIGFRFNCHCTDNGKEMVLLFFYFYGDHQDVDCLVMTYYQQLYPRVHGLDTYLS